MAPRRPHIEIEKLGWYMVVLVLSYSIAREFKFILVPMTFAVLISLLLIPLQQLVLRVIKNRLAATSVTVVGVFVVVGGIFTLLGIQVVEVFSNIENISEKLRAGLESLFELANQYLGLSRSDSLTWIRENATQIMNAPWRFFEQGISSSASFVLSSLLTALAIFFILFYKDIMKAFILMQFPRDKKDTGNAIISEIRQAVSGYLSGLLVVMLILAVLNSTGLWIIGVDYPVFFGAMAAIMAIIPYFGTFIGGLLPFLYAIATFDSWTGPLLVMGWYTIVQQLEGNLITPKVVGSNVRINFLVAFLALLVGGYIWGIAGVVLCLPLAAILKTIFSHVDSLKPISLLMGDRIHIQAQKLYEEWDRDQHRISALFRFKKDANK